MRRALITIALVLAVLALEWVPVPGVESAFHDLEPNTLSLGMLGLRPLLSAFVVVEFAALVVPRWRRLRVEQAGRARLTRAALVLGFLLAISQAWGVSQWVSALTEGGLVEFSGAEALVLIVSLSGTVAVTAWLGRVVTERGVGSGLSVLVGAKVASELVVASWRKRGRSPTNLLRPSVSASSSRSLGQPCCFATVTSHACSPP